MSKRKLRDREMDSDSDMEETSYEKSDDDADPASNNAEDEAILEAGLIKRIHVEEFMCHRMFTIDFGKRVNFITGQNGSGKSAIVAAIQLCLGATARNTGRGSSLAKLIREGSDGPAVVKVTIYNEGLDAYKPEVYGDQITIERQIQKRSGGGYKLIAKDGTVVSRDKLELEKLLHNMSIMVENPCCVLTQEESKKFIQGHEKDKYEFFLKATGLQRTIEEITATGVQLQEQENNVELTKRKLDVKKEHCKKLGSELKEFEGLDKIETDIRKSLMKLAWYEVSVQEDMIMKVEQDKEKVAAKYEEAQELLARSKEREDSVGNITELQEQLEAINKEQADLVPMLQDLHTENVKKQREISHIQEDIRSAQAGKKDFEHRLRNLRTQMKEMQQKALETASEGLEKQLLTEIQLRQEELEECRSQEESVRVEKSTLGQEQVRLQNELQELQGQLGGAQQGIRRRDQELNSYRSNSGNRAAVFGRGVPQVLAAIQGTVFRGPVIGPVGMYVKLRDSALFGGRVSFPVEKILGAMNSSFVVTTDYDRSMLQKILRNCGADREIKIIMQTVKSRHNIPVIPNADTIASLISVENDLIFNALVDQLSIEFIAVANDEQDADNRFCVTVNGRSDLRDRLKSVITLNGTTIRYRGGNRASEVDKKGNNHVRWIEADMTQVVAELESIIQEERRLVEGLENELRQKRTALQDLIQRLQSFDRKIKEIGSRRNMIQRQHQDLRERLSDIKAAQLIDTTPLENEAKELDDSIIDLNAQMASKEDELKLARQALEFSRSTKQKIDRQKEELLNHHKRVEEKIRIFIEQQEEIRKQRSNCQRDVERRAKELRDSEVLLTAATEKLQKLTETATNQCKEIFPEWDGERPELSRNDTNESIGKRLQTLRTHLAKQKEKAGLTGRTRELVKKELETSMEDYRRHKEDFERIQELFESLKSDHTHRLKVWRKQQKHLGVLVNKGFDEYMQTKGSSGAVTFNHEEKTLQLHVRTDNMDTNTQCRDIRQLSGGERSFSTLCLLLALGHVIESPFRIMDEYDVFLDQHSREITLQQLQEYALKPDQRGRQFIIVTPQELKGVTTSNDVRIKRMPRPRRQSAQGLQQSTLG